MNAFLARAHTGQGLVISGNVVHVTHLTLPAGEYIVFAKADVELTAPDRVSDDHVGVQLELKGPGFDADQSLHVWLNPAATLHRKETIALNLGLNFDVGSIADPHPFRVVELNAIATTDGVISVSNVTLTALTADHIEFGE